MTTEFPLEKLKKTIEVANAPLIGKLDEVKDLLNVFMEQLMVSDDDPEETDGHSNGQSGNGHAVTHSPIEVFDMETAIKASGQWECDTLRCRQCTLAQNVECLSTYEILGPEPSGEDASMLHAPIAGDPVNTAPISQGADIASSRALLRIVRPGAQSSLSTPPKLPTKSSPKAGTRDSSPEKEEASGALEEMKRPALVKLANSLGVKESTKKTKDQLVKLIARRQAKA